MSVKESTFMRKEGRLAYRNTFTCSASIALKLGTASASYMNRVGGRISYYTKYSRYNPVTLSVTSCYRSLPASRSCCTIIARNFPPSRYQTETQWSSIIIIYLHVPLLVCYVKTYLFANNLLLCASPSAMSHLSHSLPFGRHSYSFGYLHVGPLDILSFWISFMGC